MRLTIQQLSNALQKKVEALYLISGDEPLQVNEAADAVRSIAKNSAYNTRQVITIEAATEWHKLAAATDTHSLFSDRVLVDLKVTSNKIGAEGSKTLVNYCQQLPENTLLLLTMPKLDKAQLKSKWVQALDKVGVIVQLWPLDGAALLQWLRQRAQQRGLQIDGEGIKALASRVEGNLLAAAQEIEKLYILHGESKLSHSAVAESVMDSSRFDVFKLVDCVLAGHINRATKILNNLKAEGLAAPIVLWALTRDTRLLLKIKIAINKGQNKEAVLNQNRLWEQRKRVVGAAASRLKVAQLTQMLLLGAQADRQIKGRERGDCWETLLSYCVLFQQSA